MKDKDINIFQPTRQYNFKDYWKESYQSLSSIKRRIEYEINYIKENFVKREEGEDYASLTMPTIVHDDLCKYYAELNYLKRVIKVRKIWRPQDWWETLRDFAYSIYYKIISIRRKWQNRYEEGLPKEKRLPYYRKQVQKIEKQLIKLVPLDDSDCAYAEAKPFTNDSISEKVKEKAKDLLFERSYYLDEMFQGTAVEVKRLEEINDGLRKYTKFLKQQAGKWDGLTYPLVEDDAWEYSNEANLIWNPNDIDEGTMLSYEGDDYYESQFERIILIEKEIYRDECLEPCASILFYHNENPKSKNKHKISVTGNFDDEFPDWKEHKWRRPEFEHIQVCHAVHHLFDHLNLPIVDILHLNSFHLEFKQERDLYLDIIETHHPKGFGFHHRIDEYEEAFNNLK